eukprot:6426173-Prymnesium_polylepis.1
MKSACDAAEAATQHVREGGREGKEPRGGKEAQRKGAPWRGQWRGGACFERAQRARLRLGELRALDADLALGNQHVGHRARVVRVGDALGIGPVLLVHVHVDGLLGLVGLDELLLGLVEAPLVLEVHSILEVHLGQLPRAGSGTPLAGSEERMGTPSATARNPAAYHIGEGRAHVPYWGRAHVPYWGRAHV